MTKFEIFCQVQFACLCAEQCEPIEPPRLAKLLIRANQETRQLFVKNNWPILLSPVLLKR